MTGEKIAGWQVESVIFLNKIYYVYKSNRWYNSKKCM